MGLVPLSLVCELGGQCLMFDDCLGCWVLCVGCSMLWTVYYVLYTALAGWLAGWDGEPRERFLSCRACLLGIQIPVILPIFRSSAWIVRAYS